MFEEVSLPQSSCVLSEVTRITDSERQRLRIKGFLGCLLAIPVVRDTESATFRFRISSGTDRVSIYIIGVRCYRCVPYNDVTQNVTMPPKVIAKRSLRSRNIELNQLE